MASVLYSKLANRDLTEIAAFTFERWGNDQAERYVRALFKVCRLLAEQPTMGRPTVTGHPAWRRFEHESHVVLYTTSRAGITVQRIIADGARKDCAPSPADEPCRIRQDAHRTFASISA